MGPNYDLNQRLISEIVQIPNARFKEEYFKIICGKKNQSSLKLLELSIHKGKELFEIPTHVTGMQLNMTQGMIEDYVDAVKEIFLNYISQIQSMSPTPTCLKEEIPELDQFFTEIKYLQEDVDMNVLFEKKDEKIFDKLKSYPDAFKKCQARFKKKLKSPPKASSKKD